MGKSLKSKLYPEKNTKAYDCIKNVKFLYGKETVGTVNMSRKQASSVGWIYERSCSVTKAPGETMKRRHGQFIREEGWRQLCGQEHWLLLQRTTALYPAPTWWLTAICL